MRISVCMRIFDIHFGFRYTDIKMVKKIPVSIKDRTTSSDQSPYVTN